MAILHKVEMYILDMNNMFDKNTESLIGQIDNNNEDLYFIGFNGKSSKKFEWDDSLKINYSNATQKRL